MRRTMTLLELLTGVAIVAVLTAIALPALHMQLSAKRAELAPNTNSMLATSFAYYHATGVFCGTAQCPTALPGKTKRVFHDGSPSCACFKTMGWEPDGEVYGWYRTNQYFAVASFNCDIQLPTVLDRAIVAQGWSDLDGDGQRAEYWDAQGMIGSEQFATFQVGLCRENTVY